MKTWLLAVCLLAAACDGSLPTCAGGNCGTQVSSRGTVQYPTNRKVDILFVVDDTAAMAPHRDAVAAGIADMAGDLNQPVRPLSLHVGFIRAGSCNAGTRAAACGVTRGESFLRSEWCQTVTNAAGGFVDTFSCLADFGTDDCGPGQPLSAALQVLGGSPLPGWEGFLRADAYLLIVVVSAADDASGPNGALTPAFDLAALARKLKPDPYQVVVSIIGPGDCAVGDVPAPRLTEFVQQFGSNGAYIGLCSGQLRYAVRRVTEFTNEGLPPPCAANVRDTDATMPGVQPDCTLVRTYTTSLGASVVTAIPSCDDSQPPCWSPAAAICPGNVPGYAFNIAGQPDWCMEAPTIFTLECLSCADPNDPACAVTSAAR